jgi:hypothetical protein
MSLANRMVQARRPWHLWVVASLTLLWNGLGAYTIMMAQAGRLSDVNAHEAAYYAAQPTWFIVTTEIALLTPVAGAVALLLTSRYAVRLFAISAIAIVGNNAYDAASGASLALGDRGWLVTTVIVVVLALLQFSYAWAMWKRGVLR